MNHPSGNLRKISSWKLIVGLVSSVMCLMMACSFPAVVALRATPSETPILTATFAPTDTPVPTNTPNAPTVESPKTSKNLTAVTPTCYLGTWELKDISGLMKAILPTNVQNIQFSGSSGSLTMTFSNDGKMTFKADQFHNKLSANISILPITLDAAVDGSGSADYSLDSSGSLTIANPDFSGISISGTASGVVILPATRLMDLIPSLKDNLTGEGIAMGSTCSANTMTFDTGISGAPPLTFSKIGR